MLISEIYHSRQGEGLLTGTPSVFVRTSGCNLRCGFCDTPFASWEPVGEQLAVGAVVERVLQSAEDSKLNVGTSGQNTYSAPAEHVVITGGEPMLPREIDQLCEQIKSAGFHITIETAGTIFRDIDSDLMSISPKLSNSDPSESRAGKWRKKHQSKRYRPDIVKHLLEQYIYQLKFVVDEPNDLVEIEEFLELVKPNDLSRILLMPQGVSNSELAEREAWLVPMATERGFTFCPRKHIQWYGNKRGT